MNSMTGYGKATAENDGRKLTIELRSVNHRFLDISIKLPKFLNYLEDVIRKGLQDNFARGHIDVYVNYENTRTDGVKLTLNEGVAEEYLRIKDEMVKKYGVADDYTVSQMLRTPDVIITATAEENEAEISALASSALSNACEQLKTMRAYEGEKLKKDILKKVDTIGDIVKNVKVLAPKTVEAFRQKLAERIGDALKGVQLDEARLLNEVAFFTDKASIDEEITRLCSHCNQLTSMTEVKTPIGKNMDFLVQEFNREANTMGSKCNDIEITNLVLSLKNEIEKIREQVQNVE